MSDACEFPRPFKLRRLGVLPVETSIDADADECRKVAHRLGLPAIARLSCRFRLTSGQGRAIMIEGWLAAEVTQVSVISAEPFDDALAESFTLRLLPERDIRDDDFLDLDAPDVVPYQGDEIDLGDIACEQLALSLDPYPRRDGEGLDSAVDVVPVDEGTGAEGTGAETGDGEARAGGAAEGGEGKRPNPFAALARRRQEGH